MVQNTKSGRNSSNRKSANVIVWGIAKLVSLQIFIIIEEVYEHVFTFVTHRETRILGMDTRVALCASCRAAIAMLARPQSLDDVSVIV